jgi:hypothetical protein
MAYTFSSSKIGCVCVEHVVVLGSMNQSEFERFLSGLRIVYQRESPFIVVYDLSSLGLFQLNIHQIAQLIAYLNSIREHARLYNIGVLIVCSKLLSTSVALYQKIHRDKDHKNFQIRTVRCEARVQRALDEIITQSKLSPNIPAKNKEN